MDVGMEEGEGEEDLAGRDEGDDVEEELGGKREQHGEGRRGRMSLVCDKFTALLRPSLSPPHLPPFLSSSPLLS